MGARSGDSESSRDAIDDASDRLVDESRDVKLDSAMDIWRFEFSADTGYGYLLVIMKMRRLWCVGSKRSLPVGFYRSQS